MNLNNFGIAMGRLAADPKIFENADGSRKVRVSVVCKDRYKSDGGKGYQVLPMERFIAKGANLGAFGLIHEGDLIEAQYTARSNIYTDDQGETHYGLVLMIEQIEIRESKTVTERRRASKQSPTD